MWLLELLVRNAWAQGAPEPSGQTPLADYTASSMFSFDLVFIAASLVAFKLYSRWPTYERWLVGLTLIAFILYAPALMALRHGVSFWWQLQQTPWFIWMVPLVLLAVWMALKTYTQWLKPPEAAARVQASPQRWQRAAPEPAEQARTASPANDPPAHEQSAEPTRTHSRDAASREKTDATRHDATERVTPKAASAPHNDGVFLSYRRDDSADVTGRIYDRLVQRFGKAQVFKDVDSIPLGVDFREHLGDVVGRCSVVLVVIGDRWLSAGAPGARRLDDAADFVRIEIESALERRIPVVPLLVRGAAIPGDTDLPPTLRPLAYRNGIAVRPDPDFHRDMDRLITGLESHLRH